MNRKCKCLNGLILVYLLSLCLLLGVSATRVEREEQVKTSGSCGESVTWSFQSSTGTLTLSGSGEMYDFTNDGQPWSDYRSQIKQVVVNQGITYLGKYAFQNHELLKSVRLPASLMAVGYHCFSSCPQLQTIDVNSGSSYFTTDNNSVLLSKDQTILFYASPTLSGSYAIPSTVESINGYAFYDCDKLTTLQLSASLRYLGENAFPKSQALKSISVPPANSSYSTDKGILLNKAKTQILFCPAGYSGEYNIPASVTVIKAAAFSDCTGLTALTLPASVATIENDAFCRCSGLQSISFSTGLLVIGNNAFSSCTSLQELNLPEGLNSMGSSSFYGCSALSKVTLPQSLTTIPSYAFSACPLITELILGENVTRIESYALTNMSGLRRIELGSKLKSIGQRAFFNCTALETIELPDSLTTLELYAFANCGALKALVIGDGLSNIPTYAFYGCYSLKSLELGANLKSISSYAFSGSSALSYVILPDGFKTLASYSFASSGIAYLSLPDSITTINSSALTYCNKLSHVLYRGTQEQWEAVTLKDNHSVFISNGFHTNAANITIWDISGCFYSHYYCPICSDHFNYQYHSDGSHNFGENGCCIKCGVPSYLKYTLNSSDESVHITGCTVPVTELVIPDTIEGLPVTSIERAAFQGMNELTHLTLGDSVKSICYEAFHGCKSLRSIHFGEGLNTVEGYAFASCSSLTELHLPDSVETIDQYSFYNCSALRHAVLGKKLTSIPYRAFAKDTALESIVLGEALTSIRMEAFMDCSALCHLIYAGTQEQWNSLTIDSSNRYLVELSPALCHFGTEHDPIRIVTTCCGSYLSCELCPTPVRYRPTEGATHNFVDGYCQSCALPAYLHYEINPATCEVTITGYDGSVSEVRIPDTIEGLPVTSIGYKAFEYSEGLEVLHFGNQLKSIEAGAFQSCTKLRQINWGCSLERLGVASFTSCHGLINLEMPESLRYVDGSAFRECANLEQVHLSDQVYRIDTYAFSNCSKLREIYVGQELAYLWDGAFYNCDALTQIELPDTLITIGKECFYDCDALVSVSVGKGLKGLVDRAFYDCDALEQIVLPETLTILGEACFYHCDSLQSATVSGTKISTSAFAHCAALRDLILSEGVEEIWYEAFRNCNSLRTISLPTTLQWVDSDVFADCNALQEVQITDIPAWCSVHFTHLYSNPTYFGDLYLNGVLVEELVIPEGVTSIGSYCFAYCTSLQKLSLPQSLTSIGTGAFTHCSVLESVLIPEYVTELGNYVFAYCPKLRSAHTVAAITFIPEGLFTECGSLLEFHIPYAVTEIKRVAFYGCENLRCVVIPDSIKQIREYAFDDCFMLSHVLFRGSEAKWNNITVEQENDPLSLAVKHYRCSGAEVSWREFLGEIYLYCNVCDTALTEKPRCFHDEMRLINDSPASCTVAGYTGDVVCLICEEIVERGQKIPPLNHAETYSSNYKAASCVTEGYSGDTICSYCGQTLASGQVLPALNHPETKLVSECQPSCTESGYTGDIICLLCGDTLVYGTDIPELNHPETELRNGLEACCTTAGYTGDLYCLLCSSLVSHGQELPPLGHSYADGFCVSCGAEDPNHATEPAANPFLDVPNHAYYHAPVLWAVAQKITTGVEPTAFAPDSPCTRGQIVTFLWRAFGSPEPQSQDNPFTDVPYGAYYYKAVLWAVEQGITTGTSRNTFSPEDTCTRGQVATFLWRAKGKPQPQGGGNPFTDVSENAYYYQAILWAVESQVTNGTGNGMFSPDGNCTRGQIVTFLYRAMQGSE